MFRYFVFCLLFIIVPYKSLTYAEEMSGVDWLELAAISQVNRFEDLSSGSVTITRHVTSLRRPRGEKEYLTRHNVTDKFISEFSGNRPAAPRWPIAKGVCAEEETFFFEVAFPKAGPIAKVNKKAKILIIFVKFWPLIMVILFIYSIYLRVSYVKIFQMKTG